MTTLNRLLVGASLFSCAFLAAAGSQSFEQLQRIANPDVVDGNPVDANGDRFGRIVAVQGDTMAIGVPSDRTGGVRNGGSVYVYRRVAGTWTLDQRIPAPRPMDSVDRFATALAIDGDELIVGGGGIVCRGTVDVFRRGLTGWTLQQTITRTTFGEDSPYCGLGASVALAGDYLFIGAPLTSPFLIFPGECGGDCGAVVRMRRDNGIWVPDGGSYYGGPGADGLHYGATLASDGETLVIGMPGYTTDANGNGQIGAAMVMTVGQTDRSLLVPSPLIDQQFGWSVAVEGDLVAIGGPGYTTATTDIPGAVFTYRRSGTSWLPSGTIRNSLPAAEDEVGQAVAIREGAIYVSDPVAGASGNVRRHVATAPASWSPTDTLMASAASSGAGFGSVIAMDGQTLVVGAPFDTSDVPGSTEVGSVHTYGSVLFANGFD